jgi:hypothetical protein
MLIMKIKNKLVTPKLYLEQIEIYSKQIIILHMETI